MIQADNTTIAGILAEIVANEDDPVWNKWEHRCQRFQAKAQEAEATAKRLQLELEIARFRAALPAGESDQELANSSPLPGRWLTTKEAARLVRVGWSTVQRAVSEGRLKANNVGSAQRPRWRILGADLDAWVASRAQ